MRGRTIAKCPDRGVCKSSIRGFDGARNISTPSLLDKPYKGAKANFAQGFGQRFLLTVDTEEEFDWDEQVGTGSFSLDHVTQLSKFQQFCESEGVCPVYLVDWPIATSKQAVEILREPVAQGRAEIGIQLHPWVNPPMVEEITEHNSFAGNLAPELEAEKIRRLRRQIEEAFECVPQIYRAGRYGVGPATADILRQQGVAIDTSVRSHFDYSYAGGPSFRSFPLYPYWTDREHTLLELPLTTVFWGMLRRQGELIYPALWRAPWLRGVLAKLGLLERIPLTPEGITVDEAVRAIDIALDDALPILVFSFHSPSIRPGNTPYVRDDFELDRLYDWWRAAFAYCRKRGVQPTTVRDVIASVQI